MSHLEQVCCCLQEQLKNLKQLNLKQPNVNQSGLHLLAYCEQKRLSLPVPNAPDHNS